MSEIMLQKIKSHTLLYFIYTHYCTFLLNILFYLFFFLKSTIFCTPSFITAVCLAISILRLLHKFTAITLLRRL